MRSVADPETGYRKAKLHEIHMTVYGSYFLSPAYLVGGGGRGTPCLKAGETVGLYVIYFYKTRIPPPPPGDPQQLGNGTKVFTSKLI